MLMITYYFCLNIFTDYYKSITMAFEQILLSVLLVGIILILLTRLSSKKGNRGPETPKPPMPPKPITEEEPPKKEKEPITVKEEINNQPDYDYNKTNFHRKDNELNFIEEEHLYIHKEIYLTPTSNLVEGFFSEFDSQYWAEQKAYERELEDPQQILDEWGCNGALARELGIHLHKQIENHFQNKIVEIDYHFNYTSEYVNVKEKHNIKNEYLFFQDFQKNKSIRPYRTEWHIFDFRYMIAGTIDLICKQIDGTYILYDWKRSKKVGWEIDKILHISHDNYRKFGYGELSHIPDNIFNRYSLKQNIYKYILEKNYGVKISKMYLVILHSNYTKYHLVEVPDMQKEAEYMLQNKHLVIKEN